MIGSFFNPLKLPPVHYATNAIRDGDGFPKWHSPPPPSDFNERIPDKGNQSHLAII